MIKQVFPLTSVPFLYAVEAYNTAFHPGTLWQQCYDLFQECCQEVQTWCFDQRSDLLGKISNFLVFQYPEFLQNEFQVGRNRTITAFVHDRKLMDQHVELREKIPKIVKNCILLKCIVLSKYKNEFQLMNYKIKWNTSLQRSIISQISSRSIFNSNLFPSLMSSGALYNFMINGAAYTCIIQGVM